MTAILNFKSADTAFLATDTAMLEPDGRISCFMPKAIGLLATNTVIALQGPASAFPVLTGPSVSLQTYRRQTDLLEALPSALFSARQAIRLHLIEREETGLNELWLWLAMFCLAERRPKLMVMCTARMDAMPELEPFELTEHEGLVAPAFDQKTVFPPGWRGTPVEWAARAMEAQRQGECPFVPGAKIVGGQGMLWSVSAGGIEMDPVLEWPEKVGERCNPKLKGRPPMRALA